MELGFAWRKYWGNVIPFFGSGWKHEGKACKNSSMKDIFSIYVYFETFPSLSWSDFSVVLNNFWISALTFFEKKTRLNMISINLAFSGYLASLYSKSKPRVRVHLSRHYHELRLIKPPSHNLCILEFGAHVLWACPDHDYFTYDINYFLVTLHGTNIIGVPSGFEDGTSLLPGLPVWSQKRKVSLVLSRWQQ